MLMCKKIKDFVLGQRAPSSQLTDLVTEST